jgi:uncharacterized protein YidB (DUF937 family)
MDIGDLLKLGAQMFIESKQSGDAGSGLDIGSVTSALSGLVGGSRGESGFDIGSMLSKMDSNGLGGVAKSWLGDGSNESISPDEVARTLGADKIADFASTLGLSTQEATGGLSDALPQMVDNASRGGSLLDSIGGVSGAIGLAGKLFGK